MTDCYGPLVVWQLLDELALSMLGPATERCLTVMALGRHDSDYRGTSSFYPCP